MMRGDIFIPRLESESSGSREKYFTWLLKDPASVAMLYALENNGNLAIMYTQIMTDGRQA